MKTINAYLSIARPDHWFKNVFMLPGVLFGILLTEDLPDNWGWLLVLGFISACLIASANYVINEWLDREFDKYHPKKNARPSVDGKVRWYFVYLEYLVLAVSGLYLGSFVSDQFFFFSVVFLVLGFIYNVPPLRTKERTYLDVLTESLNNPVRFLLGWAIVETNYLPPSSVLLAYWMGGAFLMGIKRFAEYRFIGDPKKAGLYRRSFKYYTENSLLISSFFYAMSAAFFLGVFLIKHRIEYLLILPFFSFLFAWYLQIGLSADSSAQSPEKLYREKYFIAYLGILCVVFLVLTFVDLPELKFLLDRSLIEWK